MDFKRRDGFIEIDGKVRVERGHARKKAIATVELLSDEVTKSHYKVGAFDSLGKKIVLGEPMDYIDFMSDERTWNVFQLAGNKSVTMIDGPRKGEKIQIPNWVKKGIYPSEDEALGSAMTLATAKA